MLETSASAIIKAKGRAMAALWPTNRMTPQDFIGKWKNGGDERRDWHSFFDDLCRLVGHKTPREADPEHEWFTYEKGAAITDGGDGWADAWKKGFFGWEAKGTGKDLTRAYAQLKMYADALENPPLLIVTDLVKFEIHTNFTNTVKVVYRFTVEELADYATRRLLVAAFDDPQQLKPGTTRAAITQQAAEKFAALAEALRERKNDPHAVAHFLNRLLFCMFAEDIGLLPDNLFSKLVDSSQNRPDLFETRARDLFTAMKDGGDFALNNVEWFNGGLFDNAATLRLETQELATLQAAARLDWSEIDPSIFGTLFERGLDPDKRSQLGAHYTDPETIMKLIRPVVIEPWRIEWEIEKDLIIPLVMKAKIFEASATTSKEAAARTRAFNEANRRVAAFLERLRTFTVLDPACGSGNFLYLSLLALKDTEQRVIVDAEGLGLRRQVPAIGPANVKGIELNAYAAELARITVWIGEIQWMVHKGYGVRKAPILQSLSQIEHRDALVNSDGTEAAWPAVDVIVGNPPFLGTKKHWATLGREYTDLVRTAYDDRVPGAADLVCYWFEKANDAIRTGMTKRAGFVATNSIRSGASREVLEHTVEQSRIFEAWSDQEWINEGAAVRVSLVCFGSSNQHTQLDGLAVTEIFADLTASTVEGQGVNLTGVVKLAENAGSAFIATVKAGPFDVPGKTAREWLRLPNPNGRSNADVVRPWANGKDVSGRPADKWVVDFGTSMSEAEAALYEVPYAHVVKHVKPLREKSNRPAYKTKWWRFAEPIPKMRAALSCLSRYIATPADGKHRLFSWMDARALPDHQLVVVARDDETMFGIIHSRIHETWSLHVEKARHGVGNTPRYKPSVCFEKFPFPAGLTPDVTAKDYVENEHAQAVATAARALVDARDRWLNPAEWIDWQRTPEEAAADFPLRPVAKPGMDAELKKRTLTNLYNARPAWLDNLHRELDGAVARAYGWEWPLSDNEILGRLIDLNRVRELAEI